MQGRNSNGHDLDLDTCTARGSVVDISANEVQPVRELLPCVIQRIFAGVISV
jgi:hypothetical protein